LGETTDLSPRLRPANPTSQGSPPPNNNARGAGATA
jgi:hypothetical protein